MRSRWRRNPFIWFAAFVVTIGLVLPMGAMFVRSFLFHEVVKKDGTVHRSVGAIVETEDGVSYPYVVPGKDETTWGNVDTEDLAETRTVWSLDHYRRVFSEPRSWGLLRNSLWIALGGALLALLIGLPVAWVLARTRLFARTYLAALCLGPAVLPPYFMALGGERTIPDALMAVFDVSSGTLQILSSIVVFGCVLFPVYVLLVGPAMAAVPAGPWESARLLRGPRAAFRHVTLPAVLPAVVAAFVLTFVLALADFAVPDVLGFMLPAGQPTHLFATDVLLQWKAYSNTAQAVATSAPLILLTLALVLLALALLRRSPAFSAARSYRRREPLRLTLGKRLAASCFVVVVLLVTLAMPMKGVASWAGDRGWSSANPAGNSVGPSKTKLFDFATSMSEEKTPGGSDDRDRWLLTGLLAALLSMLVAVPLARLATRGGRLARALVILIGALPLAVPGMVLAVGTLTLWQAVPGMWLRPVEDSPTRSVLVLAVKFLPFALLAAWLALRTVHRGHEEAAALLGARARTRAWRILVPWTASGVLAGGLLVFVLALRELDTIVLIDVRVLPMRLYNKIHNSQFADEANLLFLCQLYLLGPALLAALILGLRRRLRRS